MVTAETYQMKFGISSTIENSVFPVTSSAPAGENVDEITFIQDTLDISNWELCYDSSVSAYTAAAFHTGCDGKGATVTIAEYNNGAGIKRFGGYSPVDWGLTTGGYSAPDARLFNLLTLTAFSPTGYAPHWAVYVNSGYGPTFGGGHDLRLIDGGSWNLGYCNGVITYTGWSREECASSGDSSFITPPSFKVYAVD
jgi:hypothetical protein